MHEQIQARLGKLRKEFDTGRAELDKLEKQRTYLQETVLRISGAIQVLEELLAKEHSVEQRDGSGPNEEVTIPAQATDMDETA